MAYNLDNDIKTRQPAWAAAVDAQIASRDGISAIFETVRMLADDPASAPLLQAFKPVLETVRTALAAPLPHHDRLTKMEQENLHALTQQWNGLFASVGLEPVIAEPEAPPPAWTDIEEEPVTETPAQKARALQPV